jgi:sulfur relay (sulfurtransferase) DsrC/TusE family protein
MFNLNEWNIEILHELVVEQDIAMNEEHWKVINYSSFPAWLLIKIEHKLNLTL